MLKRVIFDLDNTLMPWKEEYKEAAIKTIKECNLNIDYESFDKLCDLYEEEYKAYKTSNMANLLSKITNTKIDEKVIKVWLKYLGDMSEKDEKLIDLLEYLSQKYELVILTNWFISSQIKRLENGDLGKEEIEKRIKMQLTNEQKIDKIKQLKKEFFIIDTSNNPKENEYEELLKKEGLYE